KAGAFSLFPRGRDPVVRARSPAKRPQRLPVLVLGMALLAADYKTAPAEAAPADVPEAIRNALSKNGIKILGEGGSVQCEIWMRAKLPTGPASTEPNVALPAVPHGALLGVVRYPAEGSDRRGFQIKAGIYTLRYSLYPVNGDHQGVAPQRDFLILVRLADDPGLDAAPNFDKLMEMARKASGTPHPLTLSLSKDTSGASGLTNAGDDWVLHTRIGDTAVAIIVAGQYAG
ncbi:MAG: hypothetical protein M1541_08550, partial [Acidobacteria bacterium]|nr:hypothetical protein [Acidobacteriota bacterium]